MASRTHSVVVVSHSEARPRDPFGEPDVSIEMAVTFLEACDSFQLPLFATLMLYGLRAAEPVYLFREQIENGWLKVTCLPALGYVTKGRRDKRFPLVPALVDLWNASQTGGPGLLFRRRQPTGTLVGASLVKLTQEFERRCQAVTTDLAAGRRTILAEVIREAGGLSYDGIEHEFRAVARQLRWPKEATLKDLRHLFATSLENSGVGEFYRRYFMGHSPGRAPIATYTHANQLEIQFQKALSQDLAPLVAVISKRGATDRLS